MSVLTGLHAFTDQLDIVGSFSRPAEAECDIFLRVLDSGGVSCPEDSCRFPVDVDLGLLELAGLSSRLSRTEGIYFGGGMACSVDIWTKIKISRHHPISYPGLQNASVRITHRAWTLLQLLISSLSYPVIYIITVGFLTVHVFELLTSAIQVLPLAAARYSDFSGHEPAFAVTVIADGFYLSSGLLNVLLYAYTRPYLLPHSSDTPDNQSISIRSEFTQTRGDLPGPTILDNTHVVDRDPLPIESRSADPRYDTLEPAHRQPGTLPTTTHAGGRNISHSYESSGETLVRRGLPIVNIYDEV